ncbi:MULTISPECIES: divergent PAP2 family protein [Bacillales]|uniref:Divergent PAP2 family protein n=1 Tax=Lysinibacillus louembei TaxID=1470088 RepID=A0ABZ0RZM0_9BACI|nr:MULTISPECIES: divergent PAP2 family protein [Bacillales]MCT6924998.1 divergent PAP2 family protein [Metasolibacillus sp.]MCT6942045.1 divergent PAP2 family protein [Metasolibacillus sp.]WPK10457.1 divergent PAP2 family protein [Lysinibacillus louembei]
MELLQNTPLLIGIFAILLAQFLKVPIYFLATKKVDWHLLTSTGGMPSSHSAAVASIATAVGFETGFDSPIFAVAAMLAGIVMYDASHVRFQAGQHAAALNEIRHDLQHFFREIKRWPELNEEQKIEDLKTLLGHKKSEVTIGALSGIILSIIVYQFL